MRNEGTSFLGIDAGSTTVKLVLLGADGAPLERLHRRHGSAVRATLGALLEELAARRPGLRVRAAMSGSAAMRLAGALGTPFIQEVVAASRAVEILAPGTDVAVELGGEDAKIIFFRDGADGLRMNEACAGGTGAFIDQMAALLHTDAAGLDELASRHGRIHPIASRCGVFARTDIVPLLNEGASREDLAASVLQAVVEQTIGGLACGHPIRGRVAFLGGPLHFLPQLRRQFVETLGLGPEDVADLPDGHFIVAMGSAMVLMEPRRAAESAPQDVDGLIRLLREASATDEITPGLPPLFESEADYAAFARRHASRGAVPRADLADACGNLFLGVDLGSTTVKAVLTDASGAVLGSWYRRNRGDPLAELLPWLADLVESLPRDAQGRPAARIAGCAAAGYGADLARAALGAEISEVETVAHLRAACRLAPDATFVIDIGGQDMKCLKADAGRIAGVTLNEACSAGCGAFLETFAEGLGLDMEEFVRAALFARHPVDLGSRCTVFMNSRVKQAQKEGAEIGDIAAGLCRSVIRNALRKVLRLRDPAELGDVVLAQGGSFLNDAMLRALELEMGREVIRPDMAGLMGAWGAALLAMRLRERVPEGPAFPGAEELRSLTSERRSLRCGGCGNRCRLTLHTFSNGRKFVSGNRCERGAALATGERRADPAPNLHAWKQRRLFDREPLAPENAPRGDIGIARALNMHEHYPYWFALLTALGFRVVLSPESGREVFAMGLSSMPSQTVCHPAKLMHGHVAALLRMGVRRIFLPCVPREGTEDEPDRFSCPVVAGYPEVIRLNTDEARELGAEILTPFVSLTAPESLVETLHALLDIPKDELRAAVRAAEEAQERWRAELRAEGERVLAEMAERGMPGIVLCGRPYHADPAVHHGLPDYVASLGVAVLSEDAAAHLAAPDEPLRVRDQWRYHSRLYRAAALVRTRPDLELVQLTSFGCGLDAITADQVAEILAAGGRAHTLIKIDEGPALGAARIRVRSLLAAMRERAEEAARPPARPIPRPATFSPAMRRTHTILAPQMSPIHFALIAEAFRREGLRLEVLPEVTPEALEMGLAHVHNDACHPAIVVIGQLLHALRHGGHDVDRTALILAQTCGPCRASNYPALLRRALRSAGFPDVPVLSLSGSSSADGQPGFSVTPRLLDGFLSAALLGDMLQRLSMHVRAGEANCGETDDLLRLWLDRAGRDVASGGRNFARILRGMAADFAAVPQDGLPRPRIGIAGEILLKYHPDANNHVARLIMAEGGEPVLPDITDFFLYCASDSIHAWRSLGGRFLPAMKARMFMTWVEFRRRHLRGALKGTRFAQPARFSDLSGMAREVVSLGNQAGEGWLLTAEMLEFLHHGMHGVLCLQPFGCLPNHVTGRGVMKELRRRFPGANLMALDFDPGSSVTNQENRVKLLMSVAHARLAEELGGS